MGFFIRDLHRDLETLHSKTIRNYGGQFLTVYRGQTLTNTNQNEDVSINFSRRGLEKKPDS
ncbi:unnamed protein product, partial [Rotaria sp. Silwood1]